MPIFKNKKEFIGVSICLASAVIFGLGPVAGRGAYLDGANITFVILITTFCRAFGLTAVAFLNNYRPFRNKKETKLSFYIAIFQALSLIGIFGGSFFMPAAVVIIIMFTYSLMLLFFSSWRKEMTLNVANISSTIIALMGLVLVLNIGTQGTSYPLAGILLAILAAVTTFARMYLYAQQGNKRSPLLVGSETFIITFIFLLLLLFWEAPLMPATSTGWFMLSLSAVAITVGSFGMLYGVAYVGSYKYSMLTKLEPVFTTIFGIFLIGDFLNTTQYIGIGLVLVSLIALQLFDKQKT